jgi:hypothetical protein
MMDWKDKNFYSKWKTTCNRYVAFVDIMGFKELVLRNSHQEVYKMLINLYEGITAVDNALNAPFNEKKKRVLSDPATRITMYSDSIIIYSKDAKSKSVKDFIILVNWLIRNMYDRQMPFRGAVSFGTMTLDLTKSIFLGQPLIDAFLLSEELNFYGVVVHGSAEYEKSFLRFKSRLYKYDCPFKNGIASHFTIPPVLYEDSEYGENDNIYLPKIITGLGFRSSGSIRKYIDNTLKYINSILGK